MSYIAFANITDTVVSSLGSPVLAAYITESDSAVNDLAETLGVDSDDIADGDDLHFKVKRYAISYVCMRVCQDKMGVNNNEMADLDKYKIKYDLYKKEVDNLSEAISAEMLTGDVDEPRDRVVQTGYIFRG